MASLARELRKDLGNKVTAARRIAEEGARKVVESLAVHNSVPWDSMSAADRKLRNRLRAHGRQLGDQRDQKGAQSINRLASEVAYEHWHGMLFARFLAENDLLLMPGTTTAISLEEVEEIAREEKRDWLAVVSEYAEKMLPQIFRSGDPTLEVVLPRETRKDLEGIIQGLNKEVFQADDSLGWVYQFWQADRKEEINKSEVKIGAVELPAVTQLFTEDYMVLFLLHNTLGAWWAAKILAAQPELSRSAKNEDELRAACEVGDIEWAYLRFVKDENADGAWRPAAGIFSDWPAMVKDLTVLDPCMGSGHFLVFAFMILVAIRVAEEGLSKDTAVDCVLRDNLFGLEIDPRCTQIAAFNLAFAAWRMVGYRNLPQMNLACSGLAIGVTKSEWLRLAERMGEFADPDAKRDIFGVESNLLNTTISSRTKSGLERLYDLFAKAPLLGSLIDPHQAGGDIFSADFAQIAHFVPRILATSGGEEIAEVAVAALGLSKAAELLGRKYTLVSTNVPYLGRGKQDDELRDFINENFEEAKSDIAVAFLLRMKEFAAAGGTVSCVSPQSWLYLGPYKAARVALMKSMQWNFLSPLGTHAFETITGEIVNVSLSANSKCKWNETSKISTIDVSYVKDAQLKAKGLASDEVVRLVQANQLLNPDSRFSVGERVETPLLSEYANSYKGVATGDLNRFIGKFWERPLDSICWVPLQVSVKDHVAYGGRHESIFWEVGSGQLLDFVTEKLGEGKTGAWLRGADAWRRNGVAVSQMSGLTTSLYTGELFDENTAVIVAKNPENLPAIYSFCRSEDFRAQVRQLDASSLKIPNLTMLKVPFDIEHWTAVALNEFPNGLPKPDVRDPTQWLFAGNPKHSSSPLQVAVARLTSYRWPRQAGCAFANAPLLEDDGLEAHSDADGIVCLSALGGQPAAEQRLNAILANSFGVDWSASKLASLLAEVGFKGKTLDDWLRDGFFQQHCDLFQSRPFVWHIWDGRRDGFNVLVSYHRLASPDGEGQRTLDKIIYSYLGAWIERQEVDQKEGVDGAEGRLAAAQHLKKELEKIRRGDAPFDIFVRWKPLSDQPLGWNPDINDGVRLNVRPFIVAKPMGAKAKNACVLRTSPRINWDKDRGKEPERDRAAFPWFWKWDGVSENFAGGSEFDGVRWNDLHYSLEMKQKAASKKDAA
jgi:hypothetical protein